MRRRGTRNLGSHLDLLGVVVALLHDWALVALGHVLVECALALVLGLNVPQREEPAVDRGPLRLGPAGRVALEGAADLGGGGRRHVVVAQRELREAGVAGAQRGEHLLGALVADVVPVKIEGGEGGVLQQGGGELRRAARADVCMVEVQRDHCLAMSREDIGSAAYKRERRNLRQMQMIPWFLNAISLN